MKVNKVYIGFGALALTLVIALFATVAFAGSDNGRPAIVNEPVLALGLAIETEEEVGVPDFLTVHTNQPMKTVVFSDFASTYLENSEEARLARKIFRVKGIVAVSFINRYQIYLEKGKLFSWKHILPQVVDVLNKHFADKDKKAATPKGNKK